MARKSGCGSIVAFCAVIIGFGFFSIIWDISADAWGLSHGQVLAIFLGAALIVTMVVQWMRESGWPNVVGWWNGKRRARRAREQ